MYHRTASCTRFALYISYLQFYVLLLKEVRFMWQYLTDDAYNEFLLSFNLLKTKDIRRYKNTLYYLSNNIEGNYVEYEISKKNGKIRTIYEPSPILKLVQRNILHNILEEKRISEYAKAYQKNISLLENALPHVKQNIILKLDIMNFFDNITFKMVYNSCFREELYPKSIGVLLTNLCTYQGKLPQGAPTSSYISNIILRGFDEIIGKYCSNRNINYTRYSDDLTFSGDFQPKKIILLVKDELKKRGFKLNYDKIHIITKNKRQTVTGIVVNDKINVTKEYKRKIRQEMYYIKKYGFDEHLKFLKIDNKEKYINNLIGRINYCLQINKSDKFKEYIQFLKNQININ